MSTPVAMPATMRPITLFLAGDVMTGRGVDQILPHPSVPHLYESSVQDAREYVSLGESVSGPIPRAVTPAYIWGDALDELARVSPDARIVNLETSVTRNEDPWPEKEVLYRMHPDNVGCLTAAHIDVCVLANNHVLDWGRAGLVETLDVLQQAGLRTAGAGRTLDEAERPAVIDLGQHGRVLVLGLAHGSSGIPWDWAATPDRPGVFLLPRLSEQIAEAVGERVSRAKRPGDVVVASVHWGSNWGYEVPDAHVEFAHALIDRGVDVVHGHSSHHAKPIEMYGGKPILYGCGDFLDDYEGIAGFEAFRNDLVLMYLPRFDRGRLCDLRMVPMRIRKMRLERVAKEDAKWLKDTLCRISAPYRTAVSIATDGSLLLIP